LFRRFGNAEIRIYVDEGGGGITEVPIADILAGRAVLPAIGDQLYIGSPSKFGLAGINKTIAGVGAITTEYYNGTAFGALTSLEPAVLAGTGISTTVALTPFDMKKAGDAALDSSLYYVKYEKTGAGAAATIDDIWLGEELMMRLDAPDGSSLSIEVPGEFKPVILNALQEVVPYFQATAASNFAEVSYNVSA
jgi:hypothetical protein